MITTLYNLFLTLHQYAQSTIDILQTELGTILGAFPILSGVVERFGLSNVTLFSFMFGAGLSIFLVLAVIKFILGATPLL